MPITYKASQATLLAISDTLGLMNGVAAHNFPQPAAPKKDPALSPKN